MYFKKKINIIAHKGASKKYPGNTLLSFEKAIEMGADMLEIDLRLSKDNHVVVLHDNEILLLTGKNIELSDLCLCEIKKVKLSENQFIPDLAEVISKLKNRCSFYLDLKDENALANVIKILKEENCISSAILASKNPVVLKHSKLLEQNLKTSLLISLEDRKNIFQLGKDVQPDYLHPCWEHYSGSPSSLLDDEFFKNAEKGNYGIVIWHEEREDELEKLCKKPVFGICTDEPDMLNEIINYIGPE